MISRLNFLALLLVLATLATSPSSAWTTTTTRTRSPFKSSLQHPKPAFKTTTTTSRTPRFIDVGDPISTRQLNLVSKTKKNHHRERRPLKQWRWWLRPLAQCAKRRWLAQCAGLFLVVASLLASPRAAIASTAADVGVGVATAAAAAVPPPPPTAVMALPQSLPTAVPRIVELQLTLRLLFASLLGAAVGQERSSTHKHSAGVRTMALVALGACAFTVCSIFGFAAIGGGRCDPSRMASNVASGVGFVGAGVITTTSANPTDSRQSIVHGLTTATAIWISAAIGVACGVGMFYIASAATLSTITILKFGRVKKKFRKATAAARKGTTAAAATTIPESDTDDFFYFTDPRPLMTPPTSPPPRDYHPLWSSSSSSTTTTTTSSVEETMEDDGDDEWDSMPESHEAEEEEEEEDQRIASQTTTKQLVDDTKVAEGEDFLKEEISKRLDRDVVEFHSIGQATLLEQAHVASRSKNLTELVTNESKYRNNSEACVAAGASSSSSSSRSNTEPPSSLRRTSSSRHGSKNGGNNETSLGP